jgi:hypothetical protein
MAFERSVTMTAGEPGNVKTLATDWTLTNNGVHIKKASFVCLKYLRKHHEISL